MLPTGISRFRRRERPGGETRPVAAVGETVAAPAHEHLHARRDLGRPESRHAARAARAEQARPAVARVQDHLAGDRAEIAETVDRAALAAGRAVAAVAGEQLVAAGVAVHDDVGQVAAPRAGAAVAGGQGADAEHRGRAGRLDVADVAAVLARRRVEARERALHLRGEDVVLREVEIDVVGRRAGVDAADLRGRPGVKLVAGGSR